ncbi:hypothetical protein OUY22_02780 [Nonomuraea sp. MCN248]|uniref:Uncharacterized protein n=1 Tax=Nonomuraea corallina TaxID=2989783 RepID=A0ABT4S5W9_9ACTN|nr:hypothetical protein [Nonomuraea corallina]MDA0632325.1 hypothetical protein [Nonomuraea corallina]
MTDPITCPDCAGSGTERLAGLRLACRFCAGRGWVGGAHEPAERAPRPPEGPPPVWEDPRWRDPLVTAAFPCRRCLGAGTVTSVDRERGALGTAACACREDGAG